MQLQINLHDTSNQENKLYDPIALITKSSLTLPIEYDHNYAFAVIGNIFYWIGKGLGDPPG
jgi:hypothetical protein